MISAYILSNGSHKQFPDNTLSQFSSKLPFTFELPTHLNEKWGIALNSVGVSSNFKSDYLKNAGFPSFIQIRGKKEIENKKCILSELCFTEHPSKDKKNSDEIADYCVTDETFDCFMRESIVNLLSKWSNEHLSELHHKNIIYEFFYNDIRLPEHYEDFKNTLEDDFLKILIDGHKIRIKNSGNNDYDRVFFIREDIVMNSSPYQEMKNVTIADYENFENINYKPYTIIPNLRRAREINNVSLLIKNKIYYIFVLNMEYTSIDLNLQQLQETLKTTPNIIKIKCNNIQSQYFNNTYSNDLELFKPNFRSPYKHFFHEFQNPTYIPLNNTTLNNFTFTLTDEFDNQLNLEEGIPSLLQISFKKMEKTKKSFSIRISPNLNTHGSEIHNFSINLPKTLHFDKTWKVGLKSITFPNNFNSFPDNNNFIYFTKINNNVEVKTSFVKILIPNIIYTKESFTSMLEKKISVLGTAITIKFDTNNFLNITSTIPCRMTFSKNLSKLLGLNNNIENISEDYVIDLPKNTPFKAESVPNWDLFKPAYLMLYTDLVKPSLISDEYTNILKIIPILHTENDDNYQFQEFKTIEYREIANSYISEIKIEIRSHSGQFINFGSDFICFHLHFTNNII